MSVILKSSTRQKLLNLLPSVELAQVVAFLEKNKLSWMDCSSDGFSVEDLVVCHAHGGLVKEFLNYKKDYKLSHNAFKYIISDTNASADREAIFCDLLQNNLLPNTKTYTISVDNFLSVFGNKKVSDKYNLGKFGFSPKSQEDFLLSLYFEHFMGYNYDQSKDSLYLLASKDVFLEQMLKKQTSKLLAFIKGLGSQDGGVRNLQESDRERLVQIFIQLFNLLRLEGRINNLFSDLEPDFTELMRQKMQVNGAQERIKNTTKILASFFLDCCEVEEFWKVNILMTLKSYSAEYGNELVGVCERFENHFLQKQINSTPADAHSDTKTFKI